MEIDSELKCLMRETNYFVCTLGQAEYINSRNPHIFSTVNEFLDEWALSRADVPAVGLPLPPKNNEENQPWSYRVVGS